MKKFTLLFVALSFAIAGFGQNYLDKTTPKAVIGTKHQKVSVMQSHGQKVGRAYQTGTVTAKNHSLNQTGKTISNEVFLSKTQMNPRSPLELKKAGKVYWSGSSQAKVDYLTQNFDGTWLPTNWTQTITLTTKTWKQGNPADSPFSNVDPTSVYSAVCNYSNVGQTQNEWLKSPSITGTSAATSLRLKFYAGFSYSWLPAGGQGNPGATLQCKISTDGGSNWTLLWDANNTPSFTGWLWHEIILDISSYKSAPFMLAWQITGADGDLMGLDNVLVYEPPTIDGGVTDITAPVSSCAGLTSSENVVVKIRNYGLTAISGFPVSYKINNNTPVTVTYTGSIAAGDSATYTFTGANAANLSTAGTYLIKAYTGISGDGVHTNDTSAIYVYSGQATVPYTVGFEGAESLGWTLEDANTDGSSWDIYGGASLAHTGNNFAAYSYNSASAADDWLFTRCIQLNAGTNYQLKFYYRALDGGYPEAMNVNIGTDNSSTAMTTQLVDIPNIADTNYLLSTTGFTVPATGEYYIGFHCKSAADMYLLLLDDVSVTVGTVIDGGAADVVSPVSSCTPIPYPTNVVVKIKNYGTSPISGFPVSYQVNNGTVQTVTYSGTIAAGDSANYTFTGLHAGDFHVPGTYIIKAYTGITSDVNTLNDTTYVAIYSGAADVPFTMGFENTEDLTGWSIYNANLDSASWGLYTGATYAHTGDNFAVYAYDDANQADDWFFTKCINLTAGTSYQLQFYTRAMDPTLPESMSVYFGTSNTPGGMTTEIINLPSISYVTYTPSTAVFTVPTTGYYYLGFHATSLANMYYLFLDDISLNVVTTPVAACDPLSWDAGVVTLPGSVTSGTFTLTNNGAGTLTSSGISGLSAPFTTTFVPANVSLAPGASYTFTFTYNPTAVGATNQTAFITTNGGTINIDLTGRAIQCNTINTFPWVESFEGTYFPPDCWVKENYDGGPGWDTVASGTTPLPGWNGGTMTTPVGGGNLAAYATWITGGNVSNDQWLITPQIAIQSNQQLTFYAYRFGQYLDTVDVKISTTTNTAASFTTNLLTIDTIQMIDTTWVKFTVSLAAYAGQNVYIAFREHVTDNLTDGAFVALDMVTVENAPVTGHIISGKTRYAGKANTGVPVPNPPSYNPVIYDIDNVVVILKNYPAGTEVARDTSDATGNYQFNNVLDGSYILSYDKYVADTIVIGNDINAIDVAIVKYYIGADTTADPSRNFSAKYKKAANVDNNTSINAVDIARIKAKVGAPYNVTKNFPKGNWVAIDTMVTVAGSNLNVTLKTICYGDFNASSTKYLDSLTTWSLAKSLPAENIVSKSDESISINSNGYFEIPLKINSKVKDFSALGLELNYQNNDYKLVSVSMSKSGKNETVKINPTLDEIIVSNNDLLVTDENGVIRVVYATTNHYDVDANDEVIRFGFTSNRQLSKGELEFVFDGTGVIGDMYGNETTNAQFVMPKIFVQGNDDAGFEFTGYPNPFNSNAALTYNLPENGNVKIIVYNNIGEQVSVLVNEAQASGNHTVEFTPNKLAQGIYTFKLEFTGTETSKSIMLKMVH